MEIERFETLKRRYSVRSDETVLVDSGGGWKLARLKPGITAQQYLDGVKSKREQMIATRPAFWAYRNAVIAEFPSLEKRLMFLSMASYLGDDLDGLWSELDDAGMNTDLDTLQELARLKDDAKRERESLKDAPAELAEA
jgi:hypothetical protein